MKGFDKIKDVDLSNLDENNRLSDEVKKDEEATVETDIPQVKEKMDDPVGRYYRVDADITEGELRSFLLSHAYRQPFALLVMFFAIALPIAYAIRGLNIYAALGIAIVILVYYPVTLVFKAKKVKKQNTTFSETFHYMFDEKGCHLQLTNEAIDVEWKYFQNVVFTKTVAIIYTSRKHGYIVPLKDMGDQEKEIKEFLTEKIKKK